MDTTRSTAPSATSACRARGSLKWVLMPTRKRTLARKTVVRTYLSAVEPASAPSANCSSARLSSAIAFATPGLFVLRHIGRSLGSVRVRLRLGRAPRVEGDSELGPEATDRERHGRLVVCHVGGKPGVEGRCVEVPELVRLEVGAARLRPRRYCIRQADGRLRAPFRRGVPGPCCEDGHDREQGCLGDRDPAGASLVGVLLGGVLGVLGDLLGDFGCRKAFRHCRRIIFGGAGCLHRPDGVNPAGPSWRPRPLLHRDLHAGSLDRALRSDRAVEPPSSSAWDDERMPTSACFGVRRGQRRGRPRR
jgi:hypothetical protein